MTIDNATSTDMSALLAEGVDDLTVALNILYIPKNASGRNKFRERFPVVADYLFGGALTALDVDGEGDRSERDGLEDKAVTRRLALLATLKDMAELSVDSGVLQQDYVGTVLDEYGADLAPFLYAENIIRRVRPDFMAQKDAEREAAAQHNDDMPLNEPPQDDVQPVMADAAADDGVADDSDAALSVQEKAILSNRDKQHHNDVADDAAMLADPLGNDVDGGLSDEIAATDDGGDVAEADVAPEDNPMDLSFYDTVQPMSVTVKTKPPVGFCKDAFMAVASVSS